VTAEIPSRRVLILLASVLVAGAIGISYAGFTRAPGLHVPPWIAYVLALIFLVTAARVFEITSGHPRTGDWFALVFFGAGAVVEWWIAFGADPRWCSSSPGFIGGAAGCRVPFGIAACVSSAVALGLGWRFLRRGRRG
jgi:hypothetical protein